MVSVRAENVLAGRRVLVVEDEYFIADDLQRALKAFGAEVVGPVPSREDALAVVASNHDLDAAILDINLQGDMGYSVAEALRGRGVPFVFATGYNVGAIAPAFADVPRWEKPFDPAKLAQALRGLLGA